MKIRARNLATVCCTLFALLAITGASAPAQADDDLATKWKVNDADPKAGIPPVEERNKDPLEFAYFLQDMAARAEGAFRKGDWLNAIKYYEALGIAVPESWISFNRLCVAYAKQGRYAIAAGNCGRAVSLPMAKVIDHIRLIDYSLKSHIFGANEIRDIEASLAHLRQHVQTHPQPAFVPPKANAPVMKDENGQPRKRTRDEIVAAVRERQDKRVMAQLAGEPEPKEDAEAAPTMHLPSEIELLTCRLAVRLQDAGRLERCIGELRRLRMDEGQILGFSWAHALIAKNEKRAAEILNKAKLLGVPPLTLAAMSAQQQQSFPTRFATRLLLPLFVVAFVVAVGFAYARVRRKKLGTV